MIVCHAIKVLIYINLLVKKIVQMGIIKIKLHTNVQFVIILAKPVVMLSIQIV